VKDALGKVDSQQLFASVDCGFVYFSLKFVDIMFVDNWHSLASLDKEIP